MTLYRCISCYKIVCFNNMSNNLSNETDSLSTSQIRQKLQRLSKQQKELVDELVGTDEMIVGSVFEVYKTCSKPNCCCQRGQKHGPFTAISYSVNGKIHHRMVREEDKKVVIKDAANYKAFQKKRKQLRFIEGDINDHLDMLKKLQSREYK